MSDPLFTRPLAVCAGLVACALLSTGCDERAPTELDERVSSADRPALSSEGSHGHLDPALRRQVAKLRRATAPYHRVERAEADGWQVRFPEPCLTHAELGGMGQHLLNPDLLDAEVEVTEPEFMVYEPDATGGLRLVAVEYVVPFDVHPADAAPPTLFGHEFHANTTFGVWAFHVWAWRHNPSGFFADWNPEVSCEHAEEVRTFPDA